MPRLEPRSDDSHKGDYGRCLLVGGSKGMCGAIVLAGRAALRCGAGLVTVATPATCADVVAGSEPCYMTLDLPVDETGELTGVVAERIAERSSDCVAVGPGLGSKSSVQQLAVQLYHQLSCPVVFDADGLNALADEGQKREWVAPAGPRLFTPHPGEFRRLVGDQRASVGDLRRLAPQWAAAHGVILILKGHRTLITDGRHTYHNQTGNPGMATAGAGDVLTGVVTALLGQGLKPFDAARLGVYLHGLAGDLAARQIGQVSLIAQDLIEFLPLAIQQHQAEPS